MEPVADSSQLELVILVYGPQVAFGYLARAK